MKTAVATNDKLVEIFHIEEKENNSDYYPQVIQIVDDGEIVNIRHGEWNISTDYNRKVFICPDNLWNVVEKFSKEIEDFLLGTIKVAPQIDKSEYHIWYCDDGYMYLGPFTREGLNWITFLTKSRNIVVGHHYENKYRLKDSGMGLTDGNIIPISK